MRKPFGESRILDASLGLDTCARLDLVTPISILSWYFDNHSVDGDDIDVDTCEQVTPLRVGERLLFGDSNNHRSFLVRTLGKLAAAFSLPFEERLVNWTDFF